MNMDDLDTLKKQWQQLAARTQNLEEANLRLARQLARTKTTSLQERLANRITRMGWFGLILPVLAPLLYFELDLPWWLAIFYGLFGLVMSILSFVLGEYIRAERLTELPVAEAIARATKIKLRQRQVRIVGIILGAVLIFLMAFMLPDSPERVPIIVGGSVGLAIGLAIGVHRSLVNARLAREIIRSVE